MIEQPGIPNVMAENPESNENNVEAPFPAAQAPLWREPDLEIKNDADEDRQRKINAQNELVDKIQAMALELKAEKDEDGGPRYEFELTSDQAGYKLRIKGFGTVEIANTEDEDTPHIRGVIYAYITDPEQASR